MLLSPADSANSNARARLGEPVPTRQVRIKRTGDLVVVDDRTFDPTVHEELDAPREEPAVGDSKDPAAEAT